MKPIDAVPTLKKLALCAVLTFSLSGCAGVVIAGLTLSELLTAGSIGSALITGKGLGEHALDAVTGQDCRILEAVFRKDRAICEPKNSPETDEDFKGLVALLDTPAGETIQLADLPIGKDQLTDVDPQAKAASATILATLTAKSVQKVRRPGALHLAHLTKTTGKFDPADLTSEVNAIPISGTIAALPPLAYKHLRKRLFSSLN